MRYKLLGRSGLRVSELSLGTMTFGEEWGWGADKKTSAAIFDAYASAGGNFIDTANRYTEGTSEKWVGEFIARDREHFVLATKYTLFTKHGDVNGSGNHRKNMVQAVEASLKRLKTDCIDLYWLHAWDFTTPVDEVMRGLDDLVRAGKILYIGVSDTPAWIVSRANTMAELRGWTRFVGLQIEYSLIERTPEHDLIPMANALDIAVTPWAPLGGGLLTGKYSGASREDQPRRMKPDSARMSERNLRIADAVIAIAKEVGGSPAQVALNWLRGRPGTMVPILGARRVEQIEDNLGCLSIELSDAHRERLDEVSAIQPIFPYRFLEKEPIRNIVYAGTREKLDIPPRRE